MSLMRYNCTNYGQVYGLMTGLTNNPDDSAGTCTGFDLNKNSTATAQAPNASLKYLPWKIRVPSGVGGNCQSTIWFTAVAG